MASYIEEGKFNGITNWTQPFERTDEFPLDRSSMFDSLTDAFDYIKGDGSDKRKLGATSYIGQIISVYENGKVDVYKIVELPGGSKGLEKVGNGLGSIQADNFTVAEELAKVDNIGQVIYVLHEEIRQESAEGSDSKAVTYAAGPYIVTGVGTLSKLGTTSASGGDVAADVEKLKGDIATLDKSVVKTLKRGDKVLTPVDCCIDITYDDEMDAKSKNAISNAAFTAAYNKLVGKIDILPKFAIKVVNALPTTEIELTTIYLVKLDGTLIDQATPEVVTAVTPVVEPKRDDMYYEYIYVQNDGTTGHWELLGTLTVDLKGYLKTKNLGTEVDNLGYAKTSDIEATYTKTNDLDAKMINLTYVKAADVSKNVQRIPEEEIENIVNPKPAPTV